MTLEELHVVIDAQTKPFRDELAKMQKQLNTVSNDVTKHTSKIKSAVAGMIKAFLGLASIKVLLNLGKQAISFASELQEVQNVVDVAFGDMSWKVERFAQNSIKQFGMSEASAKKTASTYMAMGKNMGIDPNQASDMAITLAGLTGDVASFYNISQELADTKLKSVFTGETETLKDLGIVMTQANLQSYALSQGISKNIKDMTQAELTTLRYKYVLQNLSMAQGDFARTGGSWANQVRMLKEQWAQLLSIIGNGLIAVFTPVIQVINTIIGKMIALAQVISGVFGRLFGKKNNDNAFTGVAESVGKSTDAVGGYSDAIDGAGSQAKKTAKEMEGALAGFDELNVIKTPSGSDSGGGSGSAGGGGGGFATDPIDWDTAFPEPDTSGIDRAIDKVMAKIDSFMKFFDENKAIILSIISGILAGFMTLEGIKTFNTLKGPIMGFMTLLSGWELGFLDTISVILGIPKSLLGVVGIVALVTGAFIYLYQTCDEFRAIVNEAFSKFMNILSSLWNEVLVPIYELLSDMFNTIIVPIATFITEVVVKTVEVLFTVLFSFWNEVLAPIAQFLVSVLAIALQGVIDIWEKWKPLIESVFEVLDWIWTEMLSPLMDFVAGIFTDTFEEWGDVIDELISSVQGIFEGFVDFFVGIFTLDVDRAWQGITEIFTNFEKFLTDIFSTDWSKSFGIFGSILNGFFGIVSSVWGSVKGIFEGIIHFVKGVFTGNWESAWKGVKKIFASIISGIGNIFKTPLNVIIDGINVFIRGLNKIKIPEWVPGIGGFGFSINELPRLAQGGIANRATLGIFGEAGTEAILPLKHNTQGIEMIANKLLENMPVKQGDGTYLIQLVLEDGTVLAKKLIKNIKDYEIMTGKPAF